jgi:polar amino acid transport system permease protein
MNYTWDFAAVLSRSDLLLEGAKGTLQVTALSLAMAVPLGLFLALMRILPNPIISRLAIVYIDFFRSSSQFVLVFWFFYALPILRSASHDPQPCVTSSCRRRSAASFRCCSRRSSS